MSDDVSRPPELADEEERLAALYRLALLDTPPSDRFDRITRLAQRLLGVPIALVNLVDRDRQWSLSCVGVPGDDVPRAQSFCAHAIASDEPLVVPDLTRDARFSDSHFVTGEAALRFYAGQPVSGPGGHRLGTLCVVDVRPRTLGDDELAVLRDLARLVERELAADALNEALEARAAAERRTRAIMDSAAEGIVTVAGDGRVEYLNPAAGRALGLLAGEAVGRPVAELLAECGVAVADPNTPLGAATAPPDALRAAERDAASARLDALRSAERGAASAPLDARRGAERGGAATASLAALLAAGRRGTATASLRRADTGEAVPVEYTVAPIGAGEGWVVTFRDVSARVELERLRERFVSTVSHELRTPLTAITGYVEVLEDQLSGPLTDAQRGHLATVRRSADRLRALVDDLLELAESGRPAAALTLARVDLGKLSDEVAAELAPLARERGVVVDTDADGLEVAGDAGRLRRLLVNVVDNAVKFSPDGGRVEVRGHADGGGVQLKVRDNGPGIPPDELPLVGTRFFRASTAGTVPGTGLGAAIAREIAEQHGGTLEYESAAGAGTTVHLRLPARPPTA